MNQEADLIGGALQQAGEPTTITPELIKLDSDRITSDSEAPEEVFLYEFSGTPCFPRGDLTTVTGPAKSGKTYFVSMLMAAGASAKPFDDDGGGQTLMRIREEPLKVLWYDTEQSRYTTKRILVDRVGKMISLTPSPSPKGEGNMHFPDERFYVFNVRNRSVQERVEYLTQAIEAYRPDVCIIDGIADLLEDINSGPASLEVMQRLLAMAITYDCNITSIIHLNRSGEKQNLRGWIGTVMVQKSYELFNCNQDNKSSLFTVELTFSRRFRKNKMCFAIDDNGLPTSCDANWQSDCEQQTSKEHRMQDKQSFNQEFIDAAVADQYMPWNFRKLFAAAFGTTAMLGYDDLEHRVRELANIKQKQYYYRVLEEAERLRIVRKELIKNGRIGVIMLPPS
jgi:KaiC/GvpD/RAD55 family RecA-like ATPase